METLEEDVKPTILLDHVAQVQSGIKAKHSRYEDVWPADVDAAFMEAIALYPPMGKRRLKYYRLSAGMDENEAVPDTAQLEVKSFGRCQLIQAYILEKTGKNRSRKQVSSHLQRLKRIHKDNPAMSVLFSDASQPLSGNHMAPQTKTPIIASRDIIAKSSPSSTTLPKREFDHPAATHNVQHMAASVSRASASSYRSDLSSSINGVLKKPESPTNLHFSHPSLMLSPENIPLQECPAGVVHHSYGDPLFENHEPSLFRDAIAGTFQAGPNFNASTFSVSTHRLVSKRPVTGRQQELPPLYQSRTIYPHGFQPAHRINSRDNSNFPSPDLPRNLLVSPSEQVSYGSLHSVQAFHSDRRLLGQDLERDWAWPQDSDVSFSPFVAPLSRRNPFSEIRLQYPLSMYQLSPLCSERVFGSPECYTPSCESDGSMLSRGLSYSTVTSTTSLSETMSTRAPTSLPEQDMPGSPEYLATPLVIMPTPLYPLTYVHSDDRTSLLAEHQMTASHNYLPVQTLDPSSQQ